MKVEWQEYLSVGVADIDAQHRLLFDKFNAFLAACREGRAADEVNRLFLFLGTYAATHFADEERLMQRLAFPEYRRHQKQHEEFILQVAALKERLLSEGPTPGLVTSATLAINGWLIEHISIMDRAIGRFVKEKKGGAP